MLVNATWRIALGGIVLLDWSDYTDSEPSIQRTGAVEKVDGIRADFSRFIPRRNISHTLSFGRVRRFSTPAMARAFLLVHTSQLPTTSLAAECRIFLSDGSSLKLHGAVLVPGSYKATTAAEQFRASYVIAGGALTDFPIDAGSGSTGGGGLGGHTSDGGLSEMIAAPAYVLLTPGISPTAGAGNSDIEASPDFIAVEIRAGIDEAIVFTRSVSLFAPLSPGAERDVRIEIPASVLPTIDILDAANGGALLHRETGVAEGVTYVHVFFRWSGTAWIKWGPALKEVV